MITVINPASIKEGDVQPVTADLTRFDVAKQQVNLVVAALKKGLSIANKESLDLAMGTLKQAKEVEKAIEEKRTSLVKPFNTAVKTINDYAKTLTAELIQTIDSVKKECLRFQEAEVKRLAQEKKTARMGQLAQLGFNYDAAKDEHVRDSITVPASDLNASDDVWIYIITNLTERVAQASQQQAAALEEDLELAGAFGDTDDAKAIAEKVVTVSQIAAPVASAGTGFIADKLKGTTKRWTYEVIDANLLPREYLVVNTTAINTAVKGGVREIPGVRIYEDTSLTIR
jgi:hypothetical protein